MSRRVRFTPFLVAGLFVCGARGAEAANVPFAPPAVVVGATGAVDIATADMDGDGDPDVVSFDQYAHVLWTENVSGDGTAWTTHTIGTDANIALDVAAADLDRDGDTDVASVGFDGAVRWYENTAGNGGAWTSATVAGTGPARTAIEVADVDGDGDADLVSSTYLGFIAWHENTAGDGSAWTLRTVALRGLFTSSVDLHDVDRDGDPDVLAAAIEADVVTWHENVAGDGSLFTTHTIATGADGVSDVRAADVDRDGDPDAVAILRVGNAVLWYENTAGDGSAWATHTISTVSTWGRAVFLHDLDVDGDLDVVSAWGAPLGGGVVGLAWHENLGAGASWVTRTLVAGNDSYDAVVADLDGDGDPDLLASSYLLEEVRWFRNDSIHRTACFAPRPPIASGTQDAATFAPVASADLDGDGDLDALSGSDDDARLAWHENLQGDATAWTSHVITAAAGLVLYSIAPGDVDGDGDVDVVSNPAARATVFRNTAGNGSAWSSEPATPAREVSGNDLDLVDLDGDGDLDVLYPDDTGLRLAWLDNPGDGSAWVLRTIATILAPNEPEAADVDGDGDLDVVSRTGLSALLWFENLGGALSWSPPQTIADAGHQPFVVGDVDADGDPDLWSARESGTELVWLENSAGGSVWVTHTLGTSVPFSTRWQDAADLDGDGDQDGLVTDFATSSVRWYENTAGSGTTWEQHTVVDAATLVTSAGLGDLDRDGDLDVLTGQNVASTVGWASNERGQVLLPTVDQVPPSANNGDVFSMLRITVTHGGRAGDSDLELARLGLRFQEDAATDPLSSAEANALIEELRVYRDANGNGTFDPGTDTLVSTVSTLALTDGVQTIPFGDGAAVVQVAFGAPATFFVVAQLTANANEQAPNQFRVVHLATGPSATAAEDRSADIVLATACPADFESRIVGPVVPVELTGFTIE